LPDFLAVDRISDARRGFENAADSDVAQFAFCFVDVIRESVFNGGSRGRVPITEMGTRPRELVTGVAYY
jgi:hypothetical protein